VPLGWFEDKGSSENHYHECLLTSDSPSIILFCKEEKRQHHQGKLYLCSLAQLAKADRQNTRTFQHSCADRASSFLLENLLNKDSVNKIIINLKEMAKIAFQDCARK